MHPRKQAELESKQAGFVVKRNSGHEIYYSESLCAIIPLKRHDFNDNDLKYILRQIKKALERGGN